MKVCYKEFEGELVKLERDKTFNALYDLSIYDKEKEVTHSFSNVILKDVKFLGGTVSFGG